MTDSVKRLAEVYTNDNNVGMIRQQDSKLVTVWRMAITAAVVDPEGLNANWSLKTRDGGGVSSAG